MTRRERPNWTPPAPLQVNDYPGPVAARVPGRLEPPIGVSAHCVDAAEVHAARGPALNRPEGLELSGHTGRHPRLELARGAVEVHARTADGVREFVSTDEACDGLKQRTPD